MTSITRLAAHTMAVSICAPVVESPRRVLYISAWSSCHGGSSTSLLDIVSHLDRDRYEPLVLCPESGPLPDRLNDLGVPVALHSLTPFTKRKVLPFLYELPWYGRFLRRHRIDLVHGNTGCWRRSVVMSARLLGIPYIQHVRNPVGDFESDFAFRYAARVVTNSDDVALPLRAHPRFREKTQTIYNAVDLSRYATIDNNRDEIQAANRPVIGLVGQIVPRKGVLTAIQALRVIVDSVPDALLVIVGMAPPGEEAYEEECRVRARTLGLTDHICWTGYRTDVPAWMRTFDVFALPTTSEPFGKVIIESMAAGCPVIASRVGGIPEIITGPDLGTLVPPGDPDALATAILELLHNRSKAGAMAAAAHSQIEKRFSLHAMVTALQKAYDEVLAEHAKK